MEEKEYLSRGQQAILNRMAKGQILRPKGIDRFYFVNVEYYSPHCRSVQRLIRMEMIELIGPDEMYQLTERGKKYAQT